MPPAPPRRALRPPARQAAAAAGAAVTVVRPAGRGWGGGVQGGDGGSKTEWKPGAGAAPGRAGYAPRCRVSRAPRTRPSLGLRCALRPPEPPAPSARSPAARVRPAAPAPLSGGEPVAVAAAGQDVLGWDLGGVPQQPQPGLPGSERPTKMWRLVLRHRVDTLAAPLDTHTHTPHLVLLDWSFPPPPKVPLREPW